MIIMLPLAHKGYDFWLKNKINICDDRSGRPSAFGLAAFLYSKAQVFGKQCLCGYKDDFHLLEVYPKARELVVASFVSFSSA
jgi:hypothetical protein